MRQALILGAALLVLGAGSAGAQRVVEAPASLEDLPSRLDWAMEEASGMATILWTVDAESGIWRMGPEKRTLAEVLGISRHEIAGTAIILELENGQITAMGAHELEHPFHDVKGTVYALGHHSQQATFDAVSGPTLGEKAAIRRLWIAGILTDVPEAGDYISEALKTGDHRMRKAAVYALARHGGDAALPTLARTAMSDSAEEVAKASLYAMGSVKSDAALEALKRVVNSDAPRAVRNAGVYAIGNIGTEAARDVLLAVIRAEQ